MVVNAYRPALADEIARKAIGNIVGAPLLKTAHGKAVGAGAARVQHEDEHRH